MHQCILRFMNMLHNLLTAASAVADVHGHYGTNHTLDDGDAPIGGNFLRRT
ncbi:hypothetical protein D3C73_1649280 [compost metagenome]